MTFNGYFHFFLVLILISSALVVVSRDPVQSVLFLILAYLFTAGLFIIIGAELLAMLLIVIYVGAISILFLFVVMMLNLRIVELHSSVYKHLPILFFITLFAIFEFWVAIYSDLGLLKVTNHVNGNYMTSWYRILWYRNNAAYIGYILYTFFNCLVIIAGLILLVAMIGVIVLTVDFKYRASKKSEAYSNVKRNLTTVSFWRTKKKPK